MDDTTTARPEEATELKRKNREDEIAEETVESKKSKVQGTITSMQDNHGAGAGVVLSMDVGEDATEKNIPDISQQLTAALAKAAEDIEMAEDEIATVRKEIKACEEEINALKKKADRSADDNRELDHLRAEKTALLNRETALRAEKTALLNKETSLRAEKTALLAKPGPASSPKGKDAIINGAKMKAGTKLLSMLLLHPFSTETKVVSMDALETEASRFLYNSHKNHVDFYVRSCYHAVFDQMIWLMFDPQINRMGVVLNGSPGVGKSTFFYYILWRCVNEVQAKDGSDCAFDFIIYHHASKGRAPVVFDLKSLTCAAVDLSAELGHLATRRTLYICDTMDKANPAHTFTFTNIHTLIITSPPEEHFERFVKDLSPAMLMMPLWTPEELVDASRYLVHLLQPMTEEDIVERSRILGGTFRHVVPFYGEDIVDVTTEANANLARCQDLSELTKRILKGRYHPTKDSDKIIHIRPDPTDLRKYDLYFASPYIETEATAIVAEQSLHDMEAWLSGSLAPHASTLRGWVFENLMHDRIVKGGRYRICQVKPSGTGVSTAEAAAGHAAATGFPFPLSAGEDNSLFVDIPAATPLKTTTLVDLTRDGCYYRPAKTNLPAVDSLSPPNVAWQHTMCALQSSSDHTVDDLGLKKAFDAIGAKAHGHLIFVVPSYKWHAVDVSTMVAQATSNAVDSSDLPNTVDRLTRAQLLALSSSLPNHPSGKVRKAELVEYMIKQVEDGTLDVHDVLRQLGATGGVQVTQWVIQMP